MMNKIAKFEKVSFEQFFSDIKDSVTENEKAARYLYDNILLPHRSTQFSAGYDFFTPIGFELAAGETIKIPTGIKCRIDDAYALFLFPRSSLGFKYRLQLDNTVGIVDADYYNNNSNEGHIFIKITNDSKTDKTLELNEGSAFAQGIFLQYGITEDDDADGIREGGIGSTDKQ